MARRLSVSTLILRTPLRIPSWISSMGTPQVGLSFPPYWLMTSWSSLGTLEEPCITKWVLGMRLWISMRRPILRVSPVGLLVNL